MSGRLQCMRVIVVVGILFASALVPFALAGEFDFVNVYAEIEPEEITDNVFNLVGKEYTLIMAGSIPDHNAMTASFGGMGILFEKPVTWCYLRANRFTLEKILADKTFTMSYLSDGYKDQLYYLGGRSGRDTDKMQKVALSAITTPSGLATVEEARLILECRLVEVTTVNPDDFYDEAGREFVQQAYAEVGEYHKIVFAEITKVWRKR